MVGPSLIILDVTDALGIFYQHEILKSLGDLALATSLDCNILVVDHYSQSARLVKKLRELTSLPEIEKIFASISPSDLLLNLDNILADSSTTDTIGNSELPTTILSQEELARSRLSLEYIAGTLSSSKISSGISDQESSTLMNVSDSQRKDSDIWHRDPTNAGEPALDSNQGDWSDTCTFITDTSGNLQRNPSTVYEATTAVGSKYTASEAKSAPGDSFATYNHMDNFRNKNPEFNSRNADIESLVSENETEMDGVDPIPKESEERRYVETVIVKTLAANSALDSLYEASLNLLPRDRYVNNFRRLLGKFRNDLLDLSPDLINRELAARLKFKDARTRIARRIRDERLKCDESQERDMSKIERWLTKANSEQTYNVPANIGKEIDLHEEEEEEEVENHDDGNENEEKAKISSPFPRLDLVVQTLVQGQPFQNLVLGFQQLLLPHGLLKDILPIPHNHISFEPPPKSAVINTIQGWFETSTAVEWDWWPLSPWRPPLDHDEVRVYWRCVSHTYLLVITGADNSRLVGKCDGAC